MTATPLSVFVRISLPKPCLSRRMACGTAYCMKEFSNCSERASNTGSVGTLNGSRATSSAWSDSPARSTPSQKLAVPSRTVSGFSRNRRTSCCGEPSRPCASTPMPRVLSRPRMAWAVARREAWEVKSAMVLPFAATATSLTACSSASW